MSSRSIWRWSFLFTTCFALVVRSGNGTEPPASVRVTDDEAARAMASAYVKNRDSFNPIRCEFQLLHFVETTLDELYFGRAKPEAQAHGMLLRDGLRERREIDISDADLAEGIKRGHVVLDTRHQILDGERGLYYARDLNGAVLYFVCV